MKKIRILAIILAVLMLPLTLLAGCTTDPGNNPAGDDNCNHKWKKEVIVQRTGCTTEGVKTRECSKCGKVEVIYEEPWGHQYVETEDDEWTFNNDATCTEDGTEYRTCMVYDYNEYRVRPGSALGHDFVVYKLDEDGLTETATCRRCKTATDTRLVAAEIDFEGDRNSMSYSILDVYGNSEIKTAGDNSYIEVSKAAGTVIGDSAFGLVLTPRYDNIQNGKYVVEYDILIDENTTDLVLLSGEKEYSTEYFLSYDSELEALCSNVGAIYALDAEDIGVFNKISVVLDDAKKVYDVYFNGDLVAASVTYATAEYFPGFPLINFKVSTVEGNAACVFGVDNIAVYAADAPKGATGKTVNDFGVFVTTTGQKIAYKLPDDSCTHAYGDAVVTDPDCSNCGYSIKTCSLCEGQTVENGAAATGHNMTEDHRNEATCTEAGIIAKICDKCGFETGEALAALGHQVTTDDNLITIVAPKCLEKGYSEGPCIRCEEMIIFDYVDPTGHTFNPDSELYKKVEATCSTVGYEESQCLNCDVIFKINEVDALGHDIQVNMVRNAEGVYVIEQKCSRCDDATTIIPLSTEVPDDAAMTKYMNTGKRAVVNFTSDSIGVHDNMLVESGGWGITGISAGAARFGQMNVQQDAVTGDKYGIWQYASTATIGSGNNHCYFDFSTTPRSSGDPVVFEFEFKLDGDNPNFPLDMVILDRSGAVSSSSPYTKAVFNILVGGAIQTGDKKMTIGQLKKDEWTRFGIVLYFGPVATYDIYIDGVLQVVNYPLGSAFYTDDGFRIERSAACATDTSLCIDDLYCYYGTIPAYCVGMSCEIAGHMIDEEQEFNVVAPTCTEQGYTEGICKLCGEPSQGNFVEPLGHDLEESNVVPAECTVAGSKHVKCNREGCEYEEDLVLEAPGHTPVEGADPVVTAPTCTEDGYTTAHCSVCDNDYQYDTVEKLGHNLITQTISLPDCDSAGSAMKVCDREGCDYEEDPYTLNPLGHSYGEWSVVTPATCKDTGLQTRTCSVCFDVDEEVIEVTNEHTYGEWDIIEDAGCEDGHKERVCSTCGYVDEEVIPATGEHSYGPEQTKPATATEEGMVYQQCANCDKILVIKTIPKLAGGSQGIDYILNDEEDGYIVAGFSDALTDTAVAIPDKYDGLPVVGIGFNAFKDNTSILSIVLPDTITSIDMFAFKGCTSLTTITISGTLTDVAMNAFADCTDLTTVYYYGGTEKLVGETLAENENATIFSKGNDAFFDATWVFDE